MGFPDRIERTMELAHPLASVWAALTTAEGLAAWFGEEADIDLRPGGAWRFVMHGPDGKEYQNAKDFVEVVKPERIVFQHLGPMHRFRMTMTFEDRGGKTELTWRMLFEPDAESERLKGFIAEANEQNFDRLEAYLAAMS